MGGWQQAAPARQGFFNPAQQQQFPTVQHHHQPTFPPSQGGGGGFMAAGPSAGVQNIGTAGGFPMNQGMGRAQQGQFSGGFSQQQPHPQQQFQAMQQQQQQQVNGFHV